jgi:ATP-dependent helicase Lhr and Lhr-like helicase
MSALDRFSAPVRQWFNGAFDQPTPVQERGWAAITSGDHALLLAPTGSGKTLAAFLSALDRLVVAPPTAEPQWGTRVLYVSPLKALVHDVERNLRAPLAGIQSTAERLGEPWRPVRVAIRTGDTPSRDRQRFVKNPSDILVTTPESLFLLLTSKSREALKSVQVVIIDEIHAVAGTKRGSHMALSLERLSAICETEPQRVGLSATQRPLSAIAAFLGGDRPVTIIDASAPPALDLQVVVPIADMENPPPPSARPVGMASQGEPAGAPLLDPSGLPMPNPANSAGSDRAGIWSAIQPRILELVRAHTTTIVFCNSRRLCERLSQRLNELSMADGGALVARAHHGSISHREREIIEDALKTGALPCIVATSSLELGIDMGTVDLVIQVESPISVASGLQRVGRAGHGVGEVSRGRIFPKYRGDLLEAAVVSAAMRRGDIEATRIPRNPLDVLAQQIVALCVVQDRTVGEVAAIVRRARPYRDLTDDTLTAVLDMLSGRYPVDLAPVDEDVVPDERGFSGLSPRLVWDRASGELRARKGARLVVLSNAGTIPDRGLYGVFIAPDGPRVGELDEEMVHEVRRGDTFLLGASTWRIIEITRDRVLVSPAPGEPGRMPFWRGESAGRPVELGRSLGKLVREVGDRLADGGAAPWLAQHCGLDPMAAGNLVAYIADQQEATGTLPTDRAITVERFRDELGDWRVCVLSPFGSRVTAPWALAISAMLESEAGHAMNALWTDDGIIVRCADEEEPPRLAQLLPDPEEVEELIMSRLAASSLFAARFREAAARALLLPRRRPGQRMPLWLQRMKAQKLLDTAKRYPSFPIVLEAYRECLQDVFDLPGLIELLGRIRSRELRVVEVETDAPSPFARSLVFAFVASWLYEGDAPLAERRVQALSIDRALLRELLGEEDLRELLDADVIAEVALEVRGLDPERRARDADGVHDRLRRLGDLDEAELAVRTEGELAPLLESLRRSRRAVRVRVGGVARWIAVEDVARYRDGLGVVPPGGLPVAFLGTARNPLDALLLRFASSHGPFRAADVGDRWGMTAAQVQPLLARLAAAGRVVRGAFRSGTDEEWCDAEVLRRIKRRTLARLRGQVEPVDARALARFLPQWQGVLPPGSVARGAQARLLDALSQLEGCALPFSELERRILPARVPGYRPEMLDALGASGELVWVGRGSIGPKDGRVVLLRRDRVHTLAPVPGELPEDGYHEAILDVLGERGACFRVEIEQALGAPPGGEVEAALWDLVWAGHLTNDTLQPLRNLTRPKRRKAQAKPARGRVRGRGWGSAGALGGRWSRVDRLVTAPPDATAAAYARSGMLLDRYGVVGREVVTAEDLPGGFSSVYQVLRSMEDVGQVRRGWFVAGLGGAQFAVAGAVDRLRAWRDEVGPTLVLAATDPAVVWGAGVPWPVTEPGQTPRREAGATVVQRDGQPILYVGRGGRSLWVLPAGDDPVALRESVAALADHLSRLRARAIRVTRINGKPAETAPNRDQLVAAGFELEPGGLRLSPPL